MYYDRYLKIRDKRGLTDADVARLSGVAKATMSNWKNGKYTPKTEKLIDIAKVLEVSLSEMVGG